MPRRTATARPRARSRAATVLALAAALLGGPAGGGPAAAHESDPQVVTAVERVRPALPAGVVVQARAGLAAQLVAANPTATRLEALGAADRPFLRISRAGVFADLGSRDFFLTQSPGGSTAGVPRDLAAGAPPRWVRLSTGSSWGWYDHRLHPAPAVAPADPTSRRVLGRFAVPLRYGGRPVVAEGSVVFEPLRGGFVVSAPPPLPGLSAEVLQGRLPGLLLRVADGTSLTVFGRDREPFLRFTPFGAEVNLASRTYVEDRQAKGAPAAPPGPVPRWSALPDRSYSWLDVRLRYPSAAPPAEALRSSRASTVMTWSVPVTLDGLPSALAGEVAWVPVGATPPRPGGSSGGGPGSPLLVLAVVLVVVLLAAGGVVLLSRSGRSGGPARPAPPR